MVSTEFEEELRNYTEAELLRCATKYLRMAFIEMSEPSGDEESQEYLDFIYMECVHRGKEWLFDKAQEKCLRESNTFCKLPFKVDEEIKAQSDEVEEVEEDQAIELAESA